MTGPGGPPEPDDADRIRRRVLWKLPSGLYVVGSAAGSRRNAMTANWVTQVATRPRLLAVGVQSDSYTLQLIREGRVFSVNVLAREDRGAVRKFVKPVEVDELARTLNGFGFHEELTGAPVLDMALAWVDCRAQEELELGSHSLVVGEVVGAGFQRSEDTPVLRMEDTRMSYGG